MATRGLIPKEPTYTSQVEDLMMGVDDFMTTRQIIDSLAPKCPQFYEVAGTTLSYLKKVRVLDAIEVEGALWWFYLGEDNRSRKVLEAKVKDGKIRRRKTLTGPIDASLRAKE